MNYTNWAKRRTSYTKSRVVFLKHETLMEMVCCSGFGGEVLALGFIVGLFTVLWSLPVLPVCPAAPLVRVLVCKQCRCTIFAAKVVILVDINCQQWVLVIASNNNCCCWSWWSSCPSLLLLCYSSFAFAAAIMMAARITVLQVTWQTISGCVLDHIQTSYSNCNNSSSSTAVNSSTGSSNVKGVTEAEVQNKNQVMTD